MRPTAFRALIVCSILLGLAGSLLDFLFPGLLSTELAAAIENEPVPALFDAHPLLVGMVTIAALVAGIASTVGLFLFRRWGRTASLWLSAAALLLYPPFGATVYSGWAASVVELSSMTWGAVLALAYFSPLAARFEHAGQPART